MAVKVTCMTLLKVVHMNSATKQSNLSNQPVAFASLIDTDRMKRLLREL